MRFTVRRGGGGGRGKGMGDKKGWRGRREGKRTAGGGLRKYYIKEMSWPKGAGAGKNILWGRPGQQEVDQILRDACELG